MTWIRNLICIVLFAGMGSVVPALAATVDPLVWDPPALTNYVKAGDVSTHFTFKVLNVSTNEVLVENLRPSCGCTVVELPAYPWHLAPGSTNPLSVLVDLRGKTGKIIKEIAVLSTNKPMSLMLEINIPDAPSPLSRRDADRAWGQELAATDRQAVFKKDCVKCHLEPAFGKSGQQLYVVACGICHEAAHRATMVPDLHALKSEINVSYWRNWVTHGKPGTLMPAFAARAGGPLDDTQINSLVDYLMKTFPRPLTAVVKHPDEAND